LFVERRQIADTALNEIGIVEPGNAWILVSCVGSVEADDHEGVSTPTHLPLTRVGRSRQQRSSERP